MELSILELICFEVYKYCHFLNFFIFIYERHFLGGAIVRSRKKKLAFCIFPRYRWCGPGCSGPGAPINDVDACCYRHDRCLGRGNSPCQCDDEFMNCLRSKITQRTQKGRNANLMYNFIKLKTTFTCNHHKRNKTR